MTHVQSFFVELYYRLQTKSPKLFRVLQLFMGLLTLAGYIPSMLQRWVGVEVPGNVITLCEDIAKYSAGFLAAAFLTVKSPAVAQTDEGEAIKVTDEKKFPYTAKAEEKEVDKTQPPPPVVDVPENK